MITEKNILSDSYRRPDTGILFLRLFIGGIVLMHNVGKLQTYNEIIDSYPAMLFGSSAVTFTVFSICETMFAVMIMCGFQVRFAAFVMALGMFLSLFADGSDGTGASATLQFVYMGIYIFFVLAGGGKYSFDYYMSGANKVSY